MELLTREGEIQIAKRIEEGINTVQSSVAEYPQAIAMILEQFDQFEAEEIRLSDIISGFVNPDEDDVAQAPPILVLNCPMMIWMMKMIWTTMTTMTTAIPKMKAPKARIRKKPVSVSANCVPSMKTH